MINASIIFDGLDLSFNCFYFQCHNKILSLYKWLINRLIVKL